MYMENVTFLCFHPFEFHEKAQLLIVENMEVFCQTGKIINCTLALSLPFFFLLVLEML